MAVQKPLVYIGGRSKQLPSGDSLAIVWSWVGSTPTTLAGYGITDAVNNFGAQTVAGVKQFSGAVLLLGNSGVKSANPKWEYQTETAARRWRNMYNATDAADGTFSWDKWNGSAWVTIASFDASASNLFIGANAVWHAGNFAPSGYMATSWTLTAGNGLTGGGSGAANRTLTLGTPGDLNGATTNTVTATSHTHAINYGSVLAASTTDLSKHIALFGATIGLCVTASRLNYNIGGSGGHYLMVGGTDIAAATSTGFAVTGVLSATGDITSNGSGFIGDGKVCIRFSDTWLRLNPDGDFTTGIYCGTGLVRHDGPLQVGTSTTNGFYVTTTVAPQWKGIELGYRNIPLTTTNAAYTFVADDAGKGRMHTDATARTYTIPAVFSAGDVLTIVNSATGNLTLTGSGVSLYLTDGTAGAAGNRTLGQRAVATVFFITATQALVMGPGVS